MRSSARHSAHGWCSQPSALARLDLPTGGGAALDHLGLPTRLDQAIPSGTTVVFKSASVLSGGSIASASSGSPVHGFDVAYAALNAFTGSVGFFLNFAQLWCVGATSATTYAIIGSLNKIPITIFGHFIFKTAITRQVSD